jgi:hypothetical protein
MGLTEQATLLSVVKPLFVRTADRTVMSHSVEDMLLSGHAFTDRVSRTVGRRVAGKSAPKGDSYGVSQTHGPRIQPRGR